MKIWGVRSGMIGDTIMALPILKFLENRYPRSYKYWAVARRFSQSAPLYFNHPLIDKIYILENEHNRSEKESELINSCDICINTEPDHPTGDEWYNNFTCCEETFRMAGGNIEDFRSMDELDRKPRLYKWFEQERIKKGIGIWPFAHYGNAPERSPTPEWWKKITDYLIKNDYTVYHFGHGSEPNIADEFNSKYKRLTNLSFIDQVKISTGMDLCFGTDSGSAWVIGAYGVPQINIISTAGRPYHTKNINALAPENFKNEAKTFSCFDNCDNINVGDVITHFEERNV